MEKHRNMNLRKLMNTPTSVQNILDSIQKLSPEEQTFLLNTLQKQHQINENQPTETNSDNPWIKLAGKYENDPQYDEVLAYIEEYRHSLDEEYYRQLDDGESIS